MSNCSVLSRLIIVVLYTLSFSIWSVDHQKRYYGQFHQDEYLNKEVFRNMRDGFFIDIGAHDGVSISNTYFFEKYLGWQGVCIEPIPEVFARLVKNRTCICVNGCISNITGREAFLRVSGYPEMLSGLLHSFDPRHLNRIKNEIAHYGGKSEVIEVDSYRLDDLLKQYKIARRIDYLNIDTEGSELKILQAIDFDSNDIFTISVENNYNDSRIYNLLASKGYRLMMRLDVDEIYQKISGKSK
ncbi:MAG TPA: FkbM family methyltransferase [Candidatus Babeliales bacterium]|nr:FkbM family methyltransferase [Candidatus Babeliales bacterium]